MIISALKERKHNEKRVAIVPDVAKKLVNDGHKVLIETGAGEQSFFRINLIKSLELKY